jgi:hypothetical protein
MSWLYQKSLPVVSSKCEVSILPKENATGQYEAEFYGDKKFPGIVYAIQGSDSDNPLQYPMGMLQTCPDMHPAAWGTKCSRPCV